MALSLYNSYSGKTELFQPADPHRVRIYNCGPTVYNYNHIGNFRAYISVDLLRRYLLLRGYGVDHTSNITDVDDKIIRNALKQKQSISEFTAPFIQAFLEDLKILQIQNVEHRPRATQSIPRMHEMIRALEQMGHTYTMDGSVYFRISSFKDYGKLSRIDPEQLKTAAGGRFTADEYSKEDLRDFALWKAPDSSDEQSWPSPWGEGRPGWHLECSAMIREIYGKEGVDIHCGGIDLLFPHHENEIAQSCAAYPQDNFVKYWVHNEHLLVDGKKMSKSLGNFYTLRELTHLDDARKLVSDGRAPRMLLEQIQSGMLSRNLRYLLLSTHYRVKLNFTFDGLSAADVACDRIQTLLDRILKALPPTTDADSLFKTAWAKEKSLPGDAGAPIADSVTLGGKALKEFFFHMDEDLNIARSLAVIFDFIKDMNRWMDEHKAGLDTADQRQSVAEHIQNEIREAFVFLYAVNEILQVMDFSNPETRKVTGVDDATATEIEEKIALRNRAKKDKNYALADSIRKELQEKGVVLKDTPDGTLWEKEK